MFYNHNVRRNSIKNDQNKYCISFFLRILYIYFFFDFINFYQYFYIIRERTKK